MNIRDATVGNNISKLCRACLADREDMQDLFQTCFSDVFVYCTSLEISENDGLPSCLCRDCVALLNTLYYFKQQCVRSDETLRQIIIPQVNDNIKEEDGTFELKYDMKYDVGLPTNAERSNYGHLNNEEHSFGCVDDTNYNNEEPDSYLEPKIHIGDPARLENESHIDIIPKTSDIKLQTPIKDLFKSNRPQFIKVNKSILEPKRRKLPPITCEFCKKLFPSVPLLHKHVKEKHTATNKRRKSLKIVKEKSKGVLFKKETKTLFKCPKCEKRFKLSERLDAHVREHYGLKPFICKICHKEYSNSRTFTMHLNRHSGKRSYICNVCGKSFNYPTVLEIHKRIHSGEKKFSCSICNTSFLQSSHLKNHMLTHTSDKPYSCTQCDKHFKSDRILKSHVERHRGLRNYVCSICGKRFLSSGELTNHMRSHTNEKPHGCTVCQKKFQSKSLLAVHNRIHTGERPYKCEVCHKDFMTSQVLKRHSITHTGAKPYICELCHRGFSQRCTLKTHMKSHQLILQGVCFETG